MQESCWQNNDKIINKKVDVIVESFGKNFRVIVCDGDHLLLRLVKQVK